MARARSGTIVVAVVLAIGLGVGALGAWWVVQARPQPGAIIDALAIPDGAVVVRHEKSSARSFVELYDRDRLRWRALVPTYAGAPGRPALAYSRRSVIVRTLRGGKPYVFAFDTAGGAKIDSFALDGDNLTTVATVSSGDGRHAAEVIGQSGGGALVIGVDLDARGLSWRNPLPWQPTAAWFAGDVLILDGGPDRRAAFGATTGAPAAAPAGAPPAPATHVNGKLELLVAPQSVTIVDRETRAVVGTIR